MIINTAVGVQRVAQDYMNVARVLNLSEWKIVTKVLFPAVLPYTLTGVRLAIGTAWLVIVAAEMLTGGVGIGFWVWDAWNNLNATHIIIAIFAIGIVGLLLEQALIALARAVSFGSDIHWGAHENFAAEDRRRAAAEGSSVERNAGRFIDCAASRWSSRPGRAASTRCARSTCR